MVLVFYIMVFIDIISLLPFSETGYITWSLKENPAVFGQDVHLRCLLPNDTCCSDYRKWNAGNQYKLIIINGVSYNISKYKEALMVNDRVSILTIFSFSEQDVNIPYECVYGFQKYRSVLHLTKDLFEFHPTETLPITPTVRGHNISFAIQFKKVFPIPMCVATLGMQNLTSYLVIIVGKAGLFYKSSLAFSYSSLKTECKESLVVKCRVGQTELIVADHKICPTSEDKDTVLHPAIVPLIFVVIGVLVIVIPICVVWKYKQLRCKHSHQGDKRSSYFSVTHEEREMNLTS